MNEAGLCPCPAVGRPEGNGGLKVKESESKKNMAEN